MDWQRHLPALFGLLASACVAGTSSESRMPPLTRNVEAVSPAPPRSEESVPTKAPSRPLNLVEFRPLLAEPTLADVRRAAEAEDFAQAVVLLRREIARQAPTGPRAARLEYQLALLQERAGDSAGAFQSFGAASSASWPLAVEAVIHQARLLLASGEPARALGKLNDVPQGLSSPRALGIRAAALAELQQHELAVEGWTKLIEQAPTEAAYLQRALSSWELAQQAEPGEERLVLARRTLADARRAQSGRSADDGLYQTAQALLTGIADSIGIRPQGQDFEAEISHVEGLFEAGRLEAAAEAAEKIQTSGNFDLQHCLLDYWKAKIAAGQREWGGAADRLTAPARKCTVDEDLHAKILYNAGKFSAADGRNMTAVRHYADLERLHPRHRLADDARLRAANAYLEVGVTARFVELLLRMPEDYPEGDMTMDGVMTLALYRIERDDWAQAAAVLERGAEVIRLGDSARGHEYSGRERYFWARALGQQGLQDKELDEYDSIVRELPLSYYMLHAYSRLLRADRKRAEQALADAQRAANEHPFSFAHRAEYESDDFLRALEMLRVGETDRGRAEIRQLGFEDGTDEALIWGVALLFDRAGEEQVAHRIARGQLTDWFAHYPAGDWVEPWQIGFPRPHLDLVKKNSELTGVPEWFIYGVMREESTFDAKVVSHAGAYGLMQLILPTARGIGRSAGIPHTAEALKQPRHNIALGSRVLANLNRRFSDNPWLAIPGYNAGPGRPARWLRERPDVDFDVWVELIPFRETRRYTKRVLASRAAYAFLYHPEQAAEALVLPERLTAP